MYRHIAKKSMGQNFLKSEPILNKIIDASDPVGNDIILEIGPGLGALTEKLLAFAGKVIAVEKDDLLFQELSMKFQSALENKKLDLIHGDILEFDPELLRNYYIEEGQKKDSQYLPPTPSYIGGGASYKLVANIPYNITGAIIEKFLSASFQPQMMVLMVQKEVAERIVAKNKKTGGPGKESILSIAVKAYGTPEYIATVKAGNFTPAPSVDSAILKIDNISRENFTNKHHEEVFFQIVKAGFSHKRKTLAGNLKNILEEDLIHQVFTENNLSLMVRAEDLGITDWIAMSKLVYTYQYGLS